MAITFRDFITFPFNRGRGIRLSQLDYDDDAAGKVLRVSAARGVEPMAMTTRGPKLAELAVSRDYTYVDVFTLGAVLDQVWTLNDSPPDGFSLDTLNLLGTAHVGSQVVRIPLTVPERWIGVWTISKIGGREVEALFHTWQPEVDIAHVLDTNLDDPRALRLALKFSRPRDSVEVRSAWLNHDAIDRFTEESFLAANGALVGKSHEIRAPVLPAGVEAGTGAFGIWIAGPLQPIFLGDPQAFGGSFNNIGQASTRGPHELTVEGTDGVWYAYPFNTAFAGVNYAIQARFAPNDAFGGVLYPLVSGTIQLYLDTIVGDPTLVPAGLTVSVYPAGVFYA